MEIEVKISNGGGKKTGNGIVIFLFLTKDLCNKL